MSLIENLDAEQLKNLCKSELENRKEFPKVSEKVNDLYKKITELSKNYDGDALTQQLNDLKNSCKQRMYKRMIDQIVNFLNHPPYYFKFNRLDLRNDTGLKNDYYLGISIVGNLEPYNPNLCKMFMFSKAAPIISIDFIALNPIAYSKFAKLMQENPDVTNWFIDFQSAIQDNEVKLKNYILMLYENSRIKLLDDIGKQEEEYIINIIKIVPEIWIHFFKVVEEYARKKVKGSKEKWHDYASRNILNNTVLSKNVNDMVTREHKKEKEEKKRLGIAK